MLEDLFFGDCASGASGASGYLLCEDASIVNVLRVYVSARYSEGDYDSILAVCIEVPVVQIGDQLRGQNWARLCTPGGLIWRLPLC